MTPRDKLRIGFAALVAAVLIFQVFPNREFRNSASEFLLSPVNFFRKNTNAISDRNSARAENRYLRRKIAELSLRLESFRGLLEENDRLRSLLDFEKRLDAEAVPAEIIARNPNEWIESFIINKGSDDGVEKSSAVCSGRGLLGKVESTFERSSSVMTVRHPAFKAGGAIRGTRINGIVTGGGKGTIRMLYIPVDAEVRRGHVVVTSEYSHIFPKGIAIGRIISVGKSKTGLYKYAVIRPFASAFDQEEVLCVR